MYLKKFCSINIENIFYGLTFIQNFEFLSGLKNRIRNPISQFSYSIPLSGSRRDSTELSPYDLYSLVGIKDGCFTDLQYSADLVPTPPGGTATLYLYQGAAVTVKSSLHMICSLCRNTGWVLHRPSVLSGFGTYSFGCSYSIPLPASHLDGTEVSPYDMFSL